MEELMKYINPEAVKGMTLYEFKKIYKEVGVRTKIDVEDAFKYLGGKTKTPNKTKGD